MVGLLPTVKIADGGVASARRPCDFFPGHLCRVAVLSFYTQEQALATGNPAGLCDTSLLWRAEVGLTEMSGHQGQSGDTCLSQTLAKSDFEFYQGNVQTQLK